MVTEGKPDTGAPSSFTGLRQGFEKQLLMLTSGYMRRESSRCRLWLPETDKYQNVLIAAYINRYQSISEGRELSLAKERHCVLSIFKICLVITYPSCLLPAPVTSNLGGLKWRSAFVSPRPMLTAFIARVPDLSLFCFALHCFNGVGIVTSASS